MTVPSFLDGAYAYAYDAENRLTMVYDDIDGNCQYTSGTDTIIAEYTYDANGRRIGKTVGSAVTKYTYSGNQVVMEYDGSGQKLRKFIYGPGMDEPICMITYAGGEEDGRYFYHF